MYLRISSAFAKHHDCKVLSLAENCESQLQSQMILSTSSNVIELILSA